MFKDDKIVLLFNKIILKYSNIKGFRLGNIYIYKWGVWGIKGTFWGMYF